MKSLLTFRKSFNEQTPQALLDSIPMISWGRMQAGVPRALNAPAGCSVLKGSVSLSSMEREKEMHTHCGGYLPNPHP
jgi:hypothetical protein